ncbi:MAG: hypothetical protein ABIT16_08110 [Croceibacterium sp.]
MIAGIYGLLVVLMLVMRLAPQSWFGRVLMRQVVELPLQYLGKLERHHLIFVILIVAMAMVAGELVLALGSVDAALIYALDVSFYIDGLLMTLALASLARTRSGLAYLRASAAMKIGRLRRVFGRRRTRSARRTSVKPSNDDDRDPAFTLAA